MSKESVGMIGIGLLGSAIAERLISAGFRVVGYDTNAECLDAFRSIGGDAAISSAGVVEQCHRVLLSLPNSEISSAVIEQVDWAMAPESVIIDTTTGDPLHAERIGKRLADRGIAFLDATVAGSSQQTRIGEVVVMVGGTADALNRSKDILNTFAKRIFHLGPCGSGTRMKLIVNLVLGLNRAVLAEGLSLAGHCGLDLPQTLEVLKSGAAYSTAMDSKGEKMIAEDFTPQARLGQHLKDVHLIQRLASQVSANTPLSEVHLQLLEQAVRAGYEGADNSAVIKAF